VIMLVNFFPSLTLTYYLARLFIVRILAVLFMLVLVLMMLDLLSTSGEILAVEGNGQPELVTYVSLRVPQLIARFLPYSVLLATIITLVALNQNSEVISMKAAGLSAHQVLAPLLVTAALVSVISFAFNERVVTRATSTLNAWNAAEYGEIPSSTGTRANVYLSDEEGVLLASKLAGKGKEISMQDVTWYQRSENGMILAQFRAETATYQSPGWQLEGAIKFDIGTAQVAEPRNVTVASGLSPEQIELDTVDPDSMPFWELSESIKAYEAVGRTTDELRAKWWHKISAPLSALLMPLLGSIAAFGLARSGQLFLRAIIGMALGFTYFVIENASLAMGNFGSYPPFLAAWGPFFLFFLVGETLLIRTEE
jgi:lipopolysaccharide export system permease protein